MKYKIVEMAEDLFEIRDENDNTIKHVLGIWNAEKELRKLEVEK